MNYHPQQIMKHCYFVTIHEADQQDYIPIMGPPTNLGIFKIHDNLPLKLE